MRLVRVAYGKKNTPPNMREYQIDGRGAVGTIGEFKQHFPGEHFQIIDPIEAKKRTPVKTMAKARANIAKWEAKNKWGV